MKQITTLFARDRKFYIVQNADGYYLAIEDIYVDADGKLNKQLNGITMKANKILAECLEEVRTQVEVDYLVANGMELMEAIKQVVLTKYANK